MDCSAVRTRLHPITKRNMEFLYCLIWVMDYFFPAFFQGITGVHMARIMAQCVWGFLDSTKISPTFFLFCILMQAFGWLKERGVP